MYQAGGGQGVNGVSNVKKHQQMRRASVDVARMFSGSLTQRDLGYFREVHQSGSNYSDELLEMCHLVGDLDGLADDEDILATVEKSARVSWLKKPSFAWGAVAACLLVVAATLIVSNGWINSADNSPSYRYVTKVGQQKEVIFPDGSTVSLNTNTLLLATYDKENRSIELLRGEAYFDVATDPQRPFRVRVNGREITVLGTAFNIRKQADEFTLAVVEGVVSLHEAGRKPSSGAELLDGEGDDNLDVRQAYRIKAGLVARFNVASLQLDVRADPQVAKRATWKNGYIRFVEARLVDVVAELNRYSARPIVIRDSTVKELSLTASLRLDNISRTMAGLKQSLPIDLVHHPDGIEIVASGQQ